MKQVMAHYLDPKNDLTFKRIFGEHKHLCISLINSMLPLETPVASIEYQPGELLPELDMLRNTIVDVRCTDAVGRQFIVEMQMLWTESFKSRVLLNASKAYVMQLDVAKEFELLQPVFSLNFVNKTFEKSPPMEHIYFHHYKIVNIRNTERQIKGLEFVFIELPRFKPQNRAERKLHDLWLRFLTEINEKTTEIPPELMENAHTREAVAYVEKSAYSKEQLAVYDKWKIDLMTARSMLGDAEEKGLEKGKVIGLEKGKSIGLEEGRAEGEAIGLEKGRAEGELKKALAVALKMLKKGMPPEDVCELSGLSHQQVEELISYE
jgi:predicted transposase/invertase (TIGR01784 family)